MEEEKLKKVMTKTERILFWIAIALAFITFIMGCIKYLHLY